MAEKINDIFSSGKGIFMWCGSTILSFISGYDGMILLLLFAIITDAFWGILNAVHEGKFVLSDLMRNTIAKVLSYCSVFLLIVGIEKVIGFDSCFCSAIIVGVIVLTEIWSICGHILIRFPNIVFFRLLKPALTGEIARKLNVSEEEVKEILEKKPKKKNK